MKSRNTMLKQFKRVLVATILILSCIITSSYATTSGTSTTTPTTTLPYIEMKVKSVGNNQILVECWGSNFTDLEGMDLVFTYDNTKLTPSNVNDNSELTELDSIKYANRPTSSDAQEAFDKASKSVLSNSFAFDTIYESVLNINIFKYLAPDGNNEALQFVISPNPTMEVNAIDPILLGTFSFKQTDGTIIEGNEFSTKRISIICNEYEDFFSRAEANGEDCTEIVEFTYGQYGSISGTVETGYYNQSKYETIGKNIVDIEIYAASDVASIDWTLVGNSYKNARINIQPIITSSYKTYCRPDMSQTPMIEPVFKLTTTEADAGNFKVGNIPYGEYIVVIDKLDYADYIVTNVVIDSTNPDIDLGNIQIEVGDFNKDGKIDRTDRTIFLGLIDNVTNIENDLGIVAFDLDDNGKYDRTDRTIMLRVIDSSLDKTIKKVV